MRRVLLTTISLLAFTATAAVAADLPRRCRPRRRPMCRCYNWTGFYLGINGGYGWGRSHWSGFGNAIPPAAWSAARSATTGRPRAARGCSASKATSTGPTSRAASPTRPARPAAKPRITGLAPCAAASATPWDRVMPYVTGGLAVGDIEPTSTGFAGVERHQAGWTAGAGIEAAIAGNWTAKVEYLHVDLGDVNCGAGPARCRRDVGLPRRHRARRLNYRF